MDDINLSTKENVLGALQGIVNYAGTQVEAAKILGVSPAYLCDVLAGRREPGKKMLDAMKLRKIIMYEHVRPEA